MIRPLVAAALAVIALQLAPAPGSIAGSVVKSGTAIRQPLRNARLELSGGPNTLIARTDGNGEFMFSNLPPGQYTMAVTCDGYIRQQRSTKIILSARQMAAKVGFELDPAPTAAGWVLDNVGEPIANVMVEALRRAYDVRGNARLSRAATGITNDRGEYRIFWLDPGDYFFYAASPLPAGDDPAPESAVAPTYFPGVGTPEGAKPVRLDIGREVRVDFRLQHAALWSVAGHTMNEVSGRAVPAALTMAPPSVDPSLSRYQAQSSAAGQFAIEGVAPGSYILVAKSGAGNQELTAVERIEIRAAPAGGAYTTTVSLSPAQVINGRLFLESGASADLRQIAVSLTSVDPALPSPPSVLARTDGQITLNGIVPGNYVVDVSNLPQDFYLKAARFGDADVLENTVSVGKRPTGDPLQILLGSDGGHLPVKTFDSKGELRTGVNVVLIPDASRRNRREQYRAGLSGDDGQVTLRGIPPGNYKAFGWEELAPNAYLNPIYLEPYEALGVPVKIEAGGNPDLSIRLIPKE
ncbi:MAG TPA: carboxypeptidase-like regulatory domain-containing protein [Terriglobia bacterium]